MEAAAQSSSSPWKKKKRPHHYYNLIRQSELDEWPTVKEWETALSRCDEEKWSAMSLIINRIWNEDRDEQVEQQMEHEVEEPPTISSFLEWIEESLATFHMIEQDVFPDVMEELADLLDGTVDNYGNMKPGHLRQFDMPARNLKVNTTIPWANPDEQIASPLSRLPQEILNLIFGYLQEEVDGVELETIGTVMTSHWQNMRLETRLPFRILCHTHIETTPANCLALSCKWLANVSAVLPSVDLQVTDKFLHFMNWTPTSSNWEACTACCKWRPLDQEYWITQWDKHITRWAPHRWSGVAAFIESPDLNTKEKLSTVPRLCPECLIQLNEVNWSISRSLKARYWDAEGLSEEYFVPHLQLETLMNHPLFHDLWEWEK